MSTSTGRGFPMRAAALKVALATAVLAAIPSAALAATGWKSTRFLSGSGFNGKSVLARCGSKLGDYTLHGTVNISNAGKLLETVTVPLEGDHRAHRFHLDSMGGGAYQQLTTSEQHKVFSQVAGVLDHVSITVLHVKGHTLRLKESYGGKSTVGTITLKTYRC